MVEVYTLKILDGFLQKNDCEYFNRSKIKAIDRQ